jgi:hypothetical protein
MIMSFFTQLVWLGHSSIMFIWAASNELWDLQDWPNYLL